MRHPDFLRRHGRYAAFTLVEVLVSMAILAFITALFSQIISSTAKSWSQGQQMLDNLGKGRAALDLIARDLRLGQFRPDLGAFALAGSPSPSPSPSPLANEYCFFVARSGWTTGSGNQRSVSLVNYSANSSGTLTRQVLPVKSDNSSPNSITFGTTSIPEMANVTPGSTSSSNNLTSADLITGVVAFRMYFVNVAPDRSQRTTTLYYVPYTEDTTPCTMAVGVAMIVLDEKTQNLLVSQGKFSALLAANNGWQPPTDLSKGIAASWQQQINTLLASSTNAYPSDVRTGMRVFETVVTIPLTASR